VTEKKNDIMDSLTQ